MGRPLILALGFTATFAQDSDEWYKLPLGKAPCGEADIRTVAGYAVDTEECRSLCEETEGCNAFHTYAPKGSDYRWCQLRPWAEPDCATDSECFFAGDLRRQAARPDYESGLTWHWKNPACAEMVEELTEEEGAMVETEEVGEVVKTKASEWKDCKDLTPNAGTCEFTYFSNVKKHMKTHVSGQAACEDATANTGRFRREKCTPKKLKAKKCKFNSAYCPLVKGCSWNDHKDKCNGSAVFVDA